MAKKKIAKKKTPMKASATCSIENPCPSKGILALAIIILTWWQPAATWAQIVITIAAAMILLSEHSNCCKK